MVVMIFMFNIYLKYNYGRPRFFSIILTMGTMFAFEWFIGRKIIDVLALKIRIAIRIIVKPLKKIVKLIKLKTGTKKKSKKGKNKWHQGIKKEQPGD